MVSGILLLFCSIALIGYGFAVQINSLVASGFALTLISVAIVEYGANRRYATPNRSVAAISSIIPGMGHFYLKQLKRGTILLIMFSIFASGMIYIFLENQPSEYSDQIILMSAIGLTGVLFFSVLDVIKICNDMNLPSDDLFDANLEEPEPYINFVMIFFPILYLVISAIYAFISEGEGMIFGIAGVVISLISLLIQLTKWSFMAR